MELNAVVAVFSAFPNNAFNLYTDSAYIFYSILQLETCSQLKSTSTVETLFLQLQTLIRRRVEPFFIGHLCAHSNLPCPLAEGNQTADIATKICCLIHSKDPIISARKAHALHHLNAHTLRLMFKITREQARDITKSCPSCSLHRTVPQLGVNPRGLMPNALWQMDVTPIPEFGPLKYVHVSIDTYSGLIFATLQTGEATKHVIAHVLTAIANMGTPQQIKTDNGPGYSSHNFEQFCQNLHISHKTGIPYNPQGQRIVE